MNILAVPEGTTALFPVTTAGDSGSEIWLRGGVLQSPTSLGGIDALTIAEVLFLRRWRCPGTGSQSGKGPLLLSKGSAARSGDI
jgi:hypothetical protein